MHALSRSKYCAPIHLQIGDQPAPELEAGRVLVRTETVALNPLDCHETTGLPRIMRLQSGLRRPKRAVVGTDMAGVVEAVGDDTTGLTVGDRVCGGAPAAFAELVSVKASTLAKLPDHVLSTDAAALPVAGLTALQGLRDKAQLQMGQRVLVVGAAGGVGSFAVQIARILGAGSVTGVCHTDKVELVASLGADQVVDYTAGDPVDRLRALGPFDVVIDTAGVWPLRQRRTLLAPNGRCIIVGAPKRGKNLGPLLSMVGGVVGSIGRRRKFVGFIAKHEGADLAWLVDQVAQGTLRPVVTTIDGLESVPRALEQLAAGHTRGKIVATLASR